MAEVAVRAPRFRIRNMARLPETSHGGTIGQLRRRRRGGALFRLDRQSREASRRRSVRPEVHAAQARQQVVQHQSAALCRSPGSWLDTAFGQVSNASHRAKRRCPRASCPRFRLYPDTTEADRGCWNFLRDAPLRRRAYIGWIDSAKREETKEKRLREAIAMMAAGKKLGLK